MSDTGIIPQLHYPLPGMSSSGTGLQAKGMIGKQLSCMDRNELLKKGIELGIRQIPGGEDAIKDDKRG
jgi:hypothetical protein